MYFNRHVVDVNGLAAFIPKPASVEAVGSAAAGSAMEEFVCKAVC
jgi:hypothetical protein